VAEALAREGRGTDALPIAEEALALVDQTSEQLFEAELHRLRGELLLTAAGPAEEAEASFHKAVAVARKQEAKSLELRAVMSLVRGARKKKQRADARAQLAETLGWFKEGFETHDLRDARTLLDEE